MGQAGRRENVRKLSTLSTHPGRNWEEAREPYYDGQKKGLYVEQYRHCFEAAAAMALLAACSRINITDNTLQPENPEKKPGNKGGEV